MFRNGREAHKLRQAARQIEKHAASIAGNEDVVPAEAKAVNKAAEAANTLPAVGSTGSRHYSSSSAHLINFR